MRYFKAEVTGKEEDCWCVSETDEWAIVFEQVKKRALIKAGRPRNAYGRWVPRSQTIPVDVFCRDNRATPDEVKDLVLEACATWNIDGICDVIVRDAAINDEFDYVSSWGFGRGDLLQKGDMFELGDLVRARDVYRDWIVGDAGSRASCLEAAKATSYSRSLAHEVSRVLEGGRRTEAGATPASTPIPVHYLLEGCDRADSDSALDALLDALHLAGRLPSLHAVRLNLDNVTRSRGHNIFDRVKEVEDVLNATLAQALSGNVLVVEYGRRDRSSEYDELPYRCFTRLVEMMRPHLDDTLVVFAIPQDRPELARRVRRMVGRPLVAIAPDAALDARNVSPDEARRYLEQRTADAGLEPDGELWSMLDEHLQDASFSDLDGLMDDWRLSQLVNDSFPAYRTELQEALELRKLQKPEGMARLDELIGLGEVKQKIRDILARVRMNQQAARLGLPIQTFSMHMAFLGAPGTGKTEVARLYGEIMKEAGILSEGRVVLVSGPDLGPMGVEEAFDRARGSVLFVDEAYAMSTAPSVIATFVALMENRRDDTVVILAGYEDEMNELFACNEGFRSRLGFVLKFPEYDENELLQIFELMCHRAKLALPEDARRVARDLLARNGRRSDFGNARYARKLFEDSLGAQQVRLAREWGTADGGGLDSEQMKTLLACDIEEAGDLSDSERPPREELAALIGLENAKRLVNELIDFMCMQKLRRDRKIDAEPVPMHMAFTGAPGTGKTEVARLMGRILRDEGVLSVGDFFEVTGASLVQPLVGAGAARVRKLFKEARGSIIFVDEAYGMESTMGGGERYSEAVTEFIDQMENCRDEVVVILAGYEDEIDELIASNPGFESRMRTRVEFPDYSIDELVDIFRLMADKHKLALDGEACEKARGIFERAIDGDDFGNARFARNLLENALLRQSSRLVALGGEPSDEQLCELLAEDIEWDGPEPSIFGFAAR